MKYDLINFLGNNVSEMLKILPFCNWNYVCSIETDIDEIGFYYEFKEKGLSLICNKNSEVNTIFIEHDRFNDKYVETKFFWNRFEVRKHFGTVAETKKPFDHPILGKYGEADIFCNSRAKVHVEYRMDSDCVKMFTFMYKNSSHLTVAAHG